jgi:hypothetical protein
MLGGFRVSLQEMDDGLENPQGPRSGRIGRPASAGRRHGVHGDIIPTAWMKPDFIVRVMAGGADIVTGAADIRQGRFPASTRPPVPPDRARPLDPARLSGLA